MFESTDHRILPTYLLDWDWDNCSGFKKNTCRLIWCFIVHIIAVAIFCGLFIVDLVQDLTIDIITDFVKTNNLQWLEIGVYLSQPIILTFITLAFISFMNQCELSLSRICYVTSLISRNFISEEEMKSVSRKNLNKILFFALFHFFVVSPLG